jgi:hypothetical protein
MTDEISHPSHQEHTYTEHEGVTAEYWDEHRLGELHAAAQYAAAELNEGGEEGQYYDPDETTDVIVPSLPADSPMHGSGLKPKALSAHDVKWNKHIEGALLYIWVVFLLPLVIPTVYFISTW